MNNIESLRAIIKDMTEDQVDIKTLNAGLLTSIATSLAIIADHVEEGDIATSLAIIADYITEDMHGKSSDHRSILG